MLHSPRLDAVLITLAASCLMAGAPSGRPQSGPQAPTPGALRVARPSDRRLPVESPEDRPAESLAVTAQTLTTSVAASATVVTVGKSFKVYVTITNNGPTTAIAVHPKWYSLTVQGTGWFRPTKFPSPLAAELEPGESKIFTFQCEAEIAGDVVISASALADGASSAVAESSPVTFVPKKGSAATTTAAYGIALLRSGSVNLPIRVIDEGTGSPIPGLTVSLAADKKHKGRALLAVFDANQRYATQLFILKGPSPDALASTVEPPPPLVVPLQSWHAQVKKSLMETLTTGWLEPFADKVNDVEGIPTLVKDVLKAVATSKNVPLPPPFTGVLPKTVSTEVIKSEDLPKYLEKQIAESAEEAAYMAILGLFAGEGGGAAVSELFQDIFQDISLEMLQLATGSVYEELGYSTLAVDEIRMGPVVIKMFRPANPDEIPTEPDSAPLSVHVTDSNGAPCAGGCIELTSPTILGLAIREVLDSQGNANIPVPLGDYDVTVCAPDTEPFQGRWTIGAGGAAYAPVLGQPEMVSGTLSAPGPTGFLPGGSQFQLTPTFKDANGTVVSCPEPVIWHVSNPPGSLVASVDDNGHVTVFPGCGAALVTAWCCGVSTLGKLVSNDCNGTSPPEPSKGLVVSPTTLYFEATPPGPAAPSPQHVALLNLTTGTLYYTISWYASWIDITTPPGGGFSVAANASGLPGGTYKGGIAVTDDNDPKNKGLVTATLFVKKVPKAPLKGTWKGQWFPKVGNGSYCTESFDVTWNVTSLGNPFNNGSYVLKILTAYGSSCPDAPGTVFSGTLFNGFLEGNDLTIFAGYTAIFKGTIVGNTISGIGSAGAFIGPFTLQKQ